MIFNSVTYLVFLALVFILFWTLPTRQRLWMLFTASITFYGFWRFDFVLLMLLSAVVDYAVSLRLAVAEKPSHRKTLLLISLCVNLGLLGYFKYLQFLVDSAWSVFGLFGNVSHSPTLNIILPLGISFYTFQTISYTVDVYRRQIEPIRDFVTYGCYVTFFPQLVAGPILRASEVIPHLQAKPAFSIDHITAGLSRILCGLFLKVFMADNIAGFVNDGFDADPASLGGLDTWTLAFLFGFQIYFDFSAYSHIALGSARLMGIQFPENFNFPYLATSPKDFWARWHISLSSWIRDYLYLPLCGVKFEAKSEGGLGQVVDRPTDSKRTQALFWTWGIMGLWHGAGFRFLLWGLYHAVMISGYRISGPLRKRVPASVAPALGWCITLPAMMAGWIFFRADSVSSAVTMYARLFNLRSYLSLGLRENNYLVAALVLVSVMTAGLLYRWQVIFKYRAVAIPAYTCAYAVMIILVIIFVRPVEQFIYFQF